MRQVLSILSFILYLTVFGQGTVAPDGTAFHSEVRVKNGSNQQVLINVVPKGSALPLQGSAFMLDPGREEVIAQYDDQGDFVSPVQKLVVSGRVTNLRGKQRTIGVLMMEKRQVDAHHRMWYYEVMSGGMRVGIGF